MLIEEAEQDQPVQVEKMCNLPEIVVAVMGVTGSGKSTFIRTASGLVDEVEVGTGLEACTAIVRDHTFATDEYKITLIDTPGFNDTYKSETEILKEIASYLADKYKNNRKLSGIIYLHAFERRMTGSSLRNLKMFRELCGDDPLENVILATTGWTEAQKAGTLEKAEEHERSLSSNRAFRKGMLDSGAKLDRFMDTRESALAMITKLAKNKTIPLQIQRELVDQEKLLIDTSAGTAVNEDLKRLQAVYEKKMAEIQQEMIEAREAQDTKVEEALTEAQEVFEKQLRGLKDQQDKLRYERRSDNRRIQQQLDDSMATIQKLNAEKIGMEKSFEKVIEDIKKNMGKLSAEERAAVEREITHVQQSPEQNKTTELLISIFNMVGNASMLLLSFRL